MFKASNITPRRANLACNQIFSAAESACIIIPQKTVSPTASRKKHNKTLLKGCWHNFFSGSNSIPYLGGYSLSINTHTAKIRSPPLHLSLSLLLLLLLLFSLNRDRIVNFCRSHYPRFECLIHHLPCVTAYASAASQSLKGQGIYGNWNLILSSHGGASPIPSESHPEMNEGDTVTMSACGV